MLVHCPSGLKGEIRELIVADDDILSAVPRGTATFQRDFIAAFERVVVSAWMRTTDVGPYPGMSALDPNRLLQADLDYLLVQIRALSDGDEITLEGQCPNGHPVGGRVHISACAVKRLTPEVFTRFRDGKPMPFVLPRLNRRVEFWLRTRAIQHAIEESQATFPKDKATEYLVARVAAVDGFDPETRLDAATKMDLKTWLKSLPRSEARALRQAMDAVDAGIDTLADVKCGQCGGVYRSDIVASPDFFPLAEGGRVS
jgi:hypothetical protein